MLLRTTKPHRERGICHVTNQRCWFQSTPRISAQRGNKLSHLFLRLSNFDQETFNNRAIVMRSWLICDLEVFSSAGLSMFEFSLYVLHHTLAYGSCQWYCQRLTNNVTYVPGLIPARYVFAILGCIGFGIIYGLKVNLSVAIVAMVNQTAVASESSHWMTNTSIAALSEMCQPDSTSSKTEVRGQLTAMSRLEWLF